MANLKRILPRRCAEGKWGGEPADFRHGRFDLRATSVVDYVYLVPVVESENGIFLKTIIPSRKATRDYLGEEGRKP